MCVNIGQTRAAFLRDAVPLLLGRIGLGRASVIISLHGSLFMHWPDGSLDQRLFRFLLRQAGTVTVLGEQQRHRLVVLGIPVDRVAVVVNTCDLAPLTAEAVASKHAPDPNRSNSLCTLHLSSLVDSKGFPEYLESLLALSRRNGAKIEAFLCGRLVSSDFSTRFSNLAAAEIWINELITQINRSSRVSVEWIKGAVGAQKLALFRKADVFVLPTKYAVEAQPIVLLEAMASGCAIVSSSIGEIPTILDNSSALLLPDVGSDRVTEAIESLVTNPSTRRRIASAGHSRFQKCYGIESHLDAWAMLLDKQENGNKRRTRRALAESAP